MQKKIKVTMPKSKKQLEHTHTFSMMEESIISGLQCKNGSTTRSQDTQIKFTTLKNTEENTDQNWTGSRLTHSIVN